MTTAISPRAPSPQTRRAANSVEWLIDNAVAYDALLATIAAAEHSIWISQLAFDADCRAYASGSDDSSLLIDALADASLRGVSVKILLNESFLLDTARPLRKALARRECQRIDVRGISRFPQLLHAKMLIADGDLAIIIGSPFVNGYWDDSSHRPVDARRPMRELGGRPLHDLSMRVNGATVATLAVMFAELWRESIGTGLPAELPVDVCRNDAHLIARTAPERLLRDHRRGLTEIVHTVEDAIAAARRMIYIEHQYLSSTRIINALRGALDREPLLEVIVVLNQNPDVTAYRGWQNTRLAAAGLFDHARVGFFTLWRAVAADAARWTCNQVFVHSKVIIIDDARVIAGSANLDGVSLHSYGADFTSRLGARVFRDVRNVDVALVVNDAESALALRERLWTEHFGRMMSTGDSLHSWRSAALSSVSTLNTRPSPSASPIPLILPYSTKPTPARQLSDVGVDRNIDLRFNPGWLEVYCSPNWVRNMFA